MDLSEIGESFGMDMEDFDFDSGDFGDLDLESLGDGLEGLEGLEGFEGLEDLAAELGLEGEEEE